MTITTWIKLMWYRIDLFFSSFYTLYRIYINCINFLKLILYISYVEIVFLLVTFFIRFYLFFLKFWHLTFSSFIPYTVSLFIPFFLSSWYFTFCLFKLSFHLSQLSFSKKIFRIWPLSIDKSFTSYFSWRNFYFHKINFKQSMKPLG